MALLELKDLHTFFRTKKGIVKAVNGVSYSVETGRTLGVVGESGSGKSVSAMSILQLLDGNGYIDSGADPDFGKVMAATMVKMEEGPYYAIPQYPSVHHTMGGLVIDTNTSVKDIYGQVIPGLFAAGEVTGGVHGTNRLGSNADADACAFGYISGYFVSTGELPDFIPDL